MAVSSKPTFSSLPLDGSVVKMKGLPFKATSEDIMGFFEGFSLQTDNVFFKRHPDGRPNGECFVVFISPNEARRATQKDRETFGDGFGDRYVRVYPTLESDVPEMQAAVVAQQNLQQQQGNGSGHKHQDSVIKVKSLPFEATQLDVIQFFEGFKLKPNGVQLVMRADNKPSGEAFMDMETPEEALRAIKEKDHKVFSEKFGERYVRLIQVSRKEMQTTLSLRFGGEGILKMKGIPFKANAADVRKFFTGYKIKFEGISFIMHNDGRPTGMAFIEFESPQEAVRAMEKDRAKFGPEYGDRFCMLQLIGRHEMDKVKLMKENSEPPAPVLDDMQAQALHAVALATLQQAALTQPSMQSLLMAGGMNRWPYNLSLPPYGSAGSLSSATSALTASALAPPSFSSLTNPQTSLGPLGGSLVEAQLAAGTSLHAGAGLSPVADLLPLRPPSLVGGPNSAVLGMLNYLQQQQQQQQQQAVKPISTPVGLADKFVQSWLPNLHSPRPDLFAPPIGGDLRSFKPLGMNPRDQPSPPRVGPYSSSNGSSTSGAMSSLMSGYDLPPLSSTMMHTDVWS